jgi:hypothetical protein
MPSVLDATLVIQIVHFLCAYWILSKLFLKPAYALVMKIDAERAALKNAAILQQEELATQRGKKVAELTEFQHELQDTALTTLARRSLGEVGSGFSQPAPAVAHRAMAGMHPEFSPQVKVSREQEKQDLIKQLAAQLKKRVIHE